MTEKLHFKDKKIIYYGPHPCQKCDADGTKGTLIVKAGPGTSKESNKKFEKMEFNFTHDSHYPNHVWKKHKCISVTN